MTMTKVKAAAKTMREAQADKAGEATPTSVSTGATERWVWLPGQSLLGLCLSTM